MSHRTQETHELYTLPKSQEPESQGYSIDQTHKIPRRVRQLKNQTSGCKHLRWGKEITTKEHKRIVGGDETYSSSNCSGHCVHLRQFNKIICGKRFLSDLDNTPINQIKQTGCNTLPTFQLRPRIPHHWRNEIGLRCKALPFTSRPWRPPESSCPFLVLLR